VAKKKEVHVEKPAPIDYEIGQGLTPKKEQSELDQAQKDFAHHPKFAKFNSQGSEQHDK
jgi:hypothetical protein